MPDRSSSQGRGAHPAGRAEEYLASRGIADRIVRFAPGATKTSQDAATALGCDLGQVVKTLLFVADGRPVLALVAGDRRGDPGAIAARAGARDAALADPATVRDATGYSVGGVSPFALPGSLPVLVDESLARFDIVYAAAGTPQSMVRLGRDELLALSGGAMARISR